MPDHDEDRKEEAGEVIDLDEQDDRDMEELVKKVLPGAPAEMQTLIKSQQQALKTKYPRRRRWSAEVISLCLSLYSRSPKAYADLKDSKMLILPTDRLLQTYKNYIPQNSGINEEVFKWMYLAAKEAKVSPITLHYVTQNLFCEIFVNEHVIESPLMSFETQLSRCISSSQSPE